MTRLAAAQGVLSRLVETALFAWREDRLFRGAVIGMGVTLAVLLLRSGVSHQDRPLLAPDTSSAGMPALLNQAGGSAMLPAPGLSGPVPKIAPGHPLRDVTVAPAPSDGDRFGTVTPGHHP